MTFRKSVREKPTPSLMHRVLMQIILTATIGVAMLTTVAYAYVYYQTADQALHELEKYVSDRIRSDSAIFELAEDNLDRFAKEYMRLYLSDTRVSETEFWKLFFVDAQGAVRMKREYFDGVYAPDGTFRYGMSGFIGNNQPVGATDFQRRIVLAYRLLSQLGPAWVNRFANVHASFPENGIVLFWPEEPWGLEARPDLRMNELSVIRSATQAENPQRKPLWTGLYYDETARKWVITYQVPVDYEGRHLINPSHDVYLTDLMERLITDKPEGGYNFMIGKDGYLIAHPSERAESQKWVGQISLDKAGIPTVTRAYELIQEQLGKEAANPADSAKVRIIYNPQDSTYLAVGELSGPGWWFVSVFPTQSIKAAAHRSALTVFFAGMLLLLLILAIVYWIIRSQAAVPLKQLRHAAEAVGEGRYKEVADMEIPLPLNMKNEIGLLATRFVEMAANIRDATRHLERIVEERTRELESANTALRALSLLDGLTEIHNRRSFDRNIAGVFAEARSGLGVFSLMLADIDDFKNYNDTYGHTEGDRILRQIAHLIQSNIREEDRVFRYGGEEFAVIFNNADAVAAGKVAERILAAVRRLQIPHRSSAHGFVTLSAGIAEYSAACVSPEDLIRKADDRLYTSKREGRNRLTV